MASAIQLVRFSYGIRFDGSVGCLNDRAVKFPKTQFIPIFDQELSEMNL